MRTLSKLARFPLALAYFNSWDHNLKQTTQHFRTSYFFLNRDGTSINGYNIARKTWKGINQTKMEGGTERHLPKTDDWHSWVHRWSEKYIIVKLSNKNPMFFVCSRIVKCLSYSTADEEHSVFVRKLYYYIFFGSSLRLTTMQIVCLQ